MQVTNTVLILVQVGVLAAGCASSSQRAREARRLTPAEEARLHDLESAAERVRVAYGAGCITNPCIPRFVVRDQLEAVAVWDGPAFRVWLVRGALSPGVDARPAVAHELSHWLLGHTPRDCASRIFDCEAAANAEAVRVLRAGWGLDQQAAVSLMYASLRAGLEQGKHMRDHEDPCRELVVFAATFDRPSPHCPAGDGR